MHIPTSLPLLALLTSTTALTIPSQFQVPFLKSASPHQSTSDNVKTSPWTSNRANEVCPLAPKVTPATADGLRPALKFIQDPAHHAKQIERLARAVQVPTTVTDFMTDPWDDGFEVFVKFQEVLEDMFPRVYIP